MASEGDFLASAIPQLKQVTVPRLKPATGVMALRRRERQRGWNLKVRSFRSFALLLLLLCLLLAFAPALLLFRRRSSQILNRKCGWLHNRPLVCAHGGDTSSAPPNTLEAYNRALKTKVDCIEIDASRTQDGILVALHDRDLRKIYGNDHIRVGDLSYIEIAKLDAGYQFGKEFQNQVVPMLANALQFAEATLEDEAEEHHVQVWSVHSETRESA